MVVVPAQGRRSSLRLIAKDSGSHGRNEYRDQEKIRMSDITRWDVEDESFWNSTGKRIASRNLWISIPSLLCGFAVWLYWAVITVQMLNLKFPFTQAELFTLAAIAGLSRCDAAYSQQLLHSHRRRSQHDRARRPRC